MNIKQMKWTFQKALELISEYEKRMPDLQEEDFETIVNMQKKFTAQAKDNSEVRKLLLDVVHQMEEEHGNK